jgi:TolA-binding protein
MLENKAGRYILFCSVSFVLIMFGSRFVTLRFGQVFPGQSSADLKRITSLETRVQELEGRIQELNSLDAKISGLEEENKRLASEAEAAKKVKPVIVYQRAASPSPGPGTDAKTTASEAMSQPGPTSEAVHKGDSMERVRQVFGRPQSVHNYTTSEVWYYDEYGRKSVTFNSDGVSSWTDMPIEP